MMKFDIDTLNKYVDYTIVCCEKHPEADLYIYGYYSHENKPTIWDDVSIHCRGMIVNGKGEVLEHPFNKFWTFKQYLTKNMALLNDNQVMKIPKGNFRILEKVDGTMCTLYWIDDKPYLATQRSFTNPKAIEATRILYEKYSYLFHKLDKKYTYIFEAVYPEADVLINYGKEKDLYLIGMIDKKTFEPMRLPNLGFSMAKDYTSIYGNIKDFNDLAALNLPNHEGFVIYFEDGSMMKLKFPWYQDAHHLLDIIISSNFSFYRKQKELRAIINKEEPKISNIDIWNALKCGDYYLDSILSHVPSYFYLMGFDYWLNENKRTIIGNNDFNHVTDWEWLKPKKVNTFDLDERMESPHIYESTVWNWEKRYLK